MERIEEESRKCLSTQPRSPPSSLNPKEHRAPLQTVLVAQTGGLLALSGWRPGYSTPRRAQDTHGTYQGHGLKEPT